MGTTMLLLAQMEEWEGRVQGTARNCNSARRESLKECRQHHDVLGTHRSLRRHNQHNEPGPVIGSERSKLPCQAAGLAERRVEADDKVVARRQRACIESAKAVKSALPCKSAPAMNIYSGICQGRMPGEFAPTVTSLDRDPVR